MTYFTDFPGTTSGECIGLTTWDFLFSRPNRYSIKTDSGCKLFSALISNLKKNSGKSRFLTGSPIGSLFPQAPSNLKIGLKEAQC